MLSPGLDRATGFANGPEMVAALQFYGDLVTKDKVASLAFGNPEDAFGQKARGRDLPRIVVLRLAQEERARRRLQGLRAALRKASPARATSFPWSNLVYKNSPHKQIVWDFLRFISNAKDDLEQHQLQGILPVWTVNLETPYVKGRPDYASTREMLAQPVPPNYYHPSPTSSPRRSGRRWLACSTARASPSRRSTRPRPGWTGS